MFTLALAFFASWTSVCALSVELNETLRVAAARRNIFLGSQFKGDIIQSDAKYKAVHTEQFSISTVGNQCKWTSTEREQGKLNLDACTAAFAYARSARQAFRGHNLCWGNDNPQWLETIANNGSSADLENALKNHITSVMQGIKKAAGGVSPYAWDVVNEAANDTAFFKPNTWYPKLPNYVDVAFRAARAADNDTLLFYNDFSVEGLTAKSKQMYMMVASMVSRGVPIDGVGLQAHLSVANSPSEADMTANIARYGKLGLKVHITEMDVKCPDPCSEDDLEKQAEVYAHMLRACLANPGVCTSFETWGFTDKYTWLTGERCKGATNCHPLPFDENYLPKKAAERLLWVLHNWTQPALVTLV